MFACDDSMGLTMKVLTMMFHNIIKDFSASLPLCFCIVLVYIDVKLNRFIAHLLSDKVLGFFE